MRKLRNKKLITHSRWVLNKFEKGVLYIEEKNIILSSAHLCLWLWRRQGDVPVPMNLYTP